MDAMLEVSLLELIAVQEHNSKQKRTEMPGVYFLSKVDNSFRSKLIKTDNSVRPTLFEGNLINNTGNTIQSVPRVFQPLRREMQPIHGCFAKEESDLKNSRLRLNRELSYSNVLYS